MFGKLKALVSGWKAASDQVGDDSKEADALPGLSRNNNGHLKPGNGHNREESMAIQGKGQKGHADPVELGGKQAGPGSKGNQGAGVGQSTAPPTSALNQKVVQAASFTNYETSDYSPQMVAIPPELMVGQTTGLAVQDAEKYMNAIMQIAVAAQAVAIKKAAENPVMEVVEIPLLVEIQKMVIEAVGVYGTVSTTAGTSSQTIISDFKTG
ncbi:MAG: hypothetical protein ABJL55_08390 [Roseibium sp.]